MTSEIQKLREITGAGVMECKKALEEAAGDFEKAKSIIYERGLTKAEKKSERATGSGLLHSYIHNGRVGVLLELRCETDFVARNPLFKELAHNLVMQIAAMNPQDINSLVAQNYVKDDSMAVEALIKTAIAKLGENIKVEKFCRYEI
ncbi:translation elongation factor Ts [Candidatus Wolfebacteria bacterium RIFCSPLOWO2_01_FULL_38_11]|uniref:Elongation factor Ts n=2 Tax=Candidatus Wolfeibacteriota TaxID=1752735 RepID=A0A0G0FUQ5_9BACT|nr:MAG: Elongation factor Ts [Candidatus Wolfebacteria bacterium GW2011_GWC1_37_10]OGM92141.1 MAG: translation elongation factor Ts [Candidatus Wolfebacteria bacterium RIFCSPLOWO2_01_FULL_38_11]